MMGTQTSGRSRTILTWRSISSQIRRVGRDLQRRLGLSAASEPFLGLVAVAVAGRVEREVSVERGRRDPAFHRDRGPLDDDAGGRVHDTPSSPHCRARW